MPGTTGSAISIWRDPRRRRARPDAYEAVDEDRPWVSFSQRFDGVRHQEVSDTVSELRVESSRSLPAGGRQVASRSRSACGRRSRRRSRPSAAPSWQLLEHTEEPSCRGAHPRRCGRDSAAVADPVAAEIERILDATGSGVRGPAHGNRKRGARRASPLSPAWRPPDSCRSVGASDPDRRRRTLPRCLPAPTPSVTEYARLRRLAFAALGATALICAGPPAGTGMPGAMKTTSEPQSLVAKSKMDLARHRPMSISGSREQRVGAMTIVLQNASAAAQLDGVRLVCRSSQRLAIRLAHVGRAAARVVRSIDREGSRDPRLQHRERAEPESLLDAASMDGSDPARFL